MLTLKMRASICHALLFKKLLHHNNLQLLSVRTNSSSSKNLSRMSFDESKREKLRQLFKEETKNESTETHYFVFSNGFENRLDSVLEFKKTYVYTFDSDEIHANVNPEAVSEEANQIFVVDLSEMSIQDQAELAGELFLLYASDKSVKSLKFIDNEAIFIPGWKKTKNLSEPSLTSTQTGDKDIMDINS